MNKHLLITAVILLLATVGKAQSWPFQFSNTTAAYTNVSSMQKVNPSSFPTSTDEFVLQLPFGFDIYNETFNEITITANGLVYFTSTTSAKVNAIIILSCELKNFNATTSGIFTATLGSAGSRTFVIEHRDMSIYFGNAGDFTNFQVWLYEGTNNIELHYGPHSNFDLDNYTSEEGPTVGIMRIDTATFQADTSYYLTGNPAIPNYYVNKPDVITPFFLDGHVDANTVYRFIHKGGSNTSVKDINDIEKQLTVFPNPATNGKVSVYFNNPLPQQEKLVLTDISGREIICHTAPAQSTLAEINTAGLAPGVYLLKTDGSKGLQMMQKVLVN